MNPRKESRESGKVERIPFGGPRLKLQLSKSDQEGFKKRGKNPHWFNDQDGRVEQAQAAGYTFVDPDHARSVGSSEDGKVSKVVTKGNDLVMKAYLMETNLSFYNEDQALKAVDNDKVDKALALGGGTGDSGVEQAYRP